MLKTMIVHTLFAALGVGLAAASGAVADFVVTLETRTKLRPRFFCRITPGRAWS